MTGIWLENLKKFVTGTLNGSKYSLDVHVANAVATAASSFSYKERRFHLPATLNLPGKGSNMIQLDVQSETASPSPADIANSISEIGINWNGDGLVEIGIGANAAAAAANIIATVGAGQSRAFGTSLSAGDKIWGRSAKTAAIADGELLVTLSG